MPLRLLYRANLPHIGIAAERAGVDWVFVDLEHHGKATRQAGFNTIIVPHGISDIATMRAVLTRAKLLVRVNPIGPWSEEEIAGAISGGADVVMLPFFATMDEVSRFVELVGGRAQLCLLVETMGAVGCVDEIVVHPGIDYIHVGLNDIHIERGTGFLFEPFADGLLEGMAAKIRPSGIPFGIGGVARMKEMVPTGEAIIAEHVRLGSTGVILSRTFIDPGNFDDGEAFEQCFCREVAAVRSWEASLRSMSRSFFESNHERMVAQISSLSLNNR
jgi:2-keto-3-deoxy-L-rhamnonate aldolase RhmA